MNWNLDTICKTTITLPAHLRHTVVGLNNVTNTGEAAHET